MGEAVFTDHHALQGVEVGKSKVLRVCEAASADLQALQRGQLGEIKASEGAERLVLNGQFPHESAVLNVQFTILSHKTALLKHDLLDAIQIANLHSADGAERERSNIKTSESIKRSQVKNGLVHIVTRTVGNH